MSLLVLGFSWFEICFGFVCLPGWGVFVKVCRGWVMLVGLRADFGLLSGFLWIGGFGL